MDAQDFRSLQEAYMEVVSNDLNEMAYKKLPVGKMMRKVSDRAEREANTRADRDRKLYVNLLYKPNHPNSDKVRTDHDIARAEHEKAKRNKERSNTMMSVADTHSETAAKAKSKLKKEQVDLYDIILSHLLDEGYAETVEGAEVIMVNMSEEWREDIIEKSGEQPLPYGRMMKKSNELASSDDPKKQKRAADIYLAANAPKGPKVKVRK